MSNLSSLPEFGEHYIQYFDPYLQSFEVRRKSRTNGNLSLSELMELIDLLMVKHQLVYVPSKDDPRVILFPFMFKEPVKGDKLINETTSEIYTVDQVILNPENGRWEGLIKFLLRNPPDVERSHSIKFLNPTNKYIRFRHEMPDEIPNLVGANLEKLLLTPPPIYPTITWTVSSVEPGSLGRFQDSRKEYKPRLRESVKDPFVPGHTVEIYGQFFDNLVQFDCWSNDPRTSDRLLRWFEQFMRLRIANLEQYGLAQGFFVKRGEDEYNKTWRQAFVVRGSQYFFRTEQLEARYSKDLLSLNINAEVSASDPTNRMFNGPRWIADQLVTGDISSSEYRELFYHSGKYMFGNIELRQ